MNSIVTSVEVRPIESLGLARYISRGHRLRIQLGRATMMSSHQVMSQRETAWRRRDPCTALALMGCAMLLGIEATARADSPRRECRLQYQQQQCWCLVDYQPKPLALPPCRVCSHLLDCYVKKPLPGACKVPCCSPDDYCRKSLPVWPCSAEPSYVCIPLTTPCGSP